MHFPCRFPLNLHLLQSVSMLPAALALSACGGGGDDPGDAINEAAAQYGIQMVNADDVHALGGTGDGVRVAVVDTGINDSHPEFIGRGVTGYNFAGGSTQNWDQDNVGHGTWVAGVIGAALDGQGMHGVAYDSQLYAYRIDSGGSPGFEGVDTDPQFAALIRQHIDDDIDISNNSWGYVYDMDSAAADALVTDSSFQATVVDAFYDAAAAGTVFVWSAGNIDPTLDFGPDDWDNPTVLGGLPYWEPGLAANWVVVMSVDINGTESDFSYQCGEAWEWCVAAPGTDIFTSDAGGGYNTVSGTSFAAPMVSGVLAILMDQLSISAEQALLRVKATADYDGLTTFDGCTIDTPGCADEMRDVFGLGLVDALAAQQVMGSLSVPLTASAEGRSTVRMAAPAGLSDRGRAALAATEIAALDSFDGAVFRIDGSEVFTETETDTRAIGYLSAGPEPRLHAARIDPEADDRLSFTHTYAPQGVNAASVEFWGDKVGLVKNLDGDQLRTDSVQVAYALTDALTLSGSVEYSDVTRETGFGLAASLLLGDRTRLMGGVSQGSYVEDMTGIDAHNMTLGEATRFEIGLRHALTDRIELFGHAEMREVGDIAASTTRWGAEDAIYGSAVLGAEYAGEDYRLSAGLYQPDQQIGGEATIQLATARSLDGQVFYRQAAFDASGTGDTGLFLAGKWDFLEGGAGELAFQLQQVPGEVEKVDKAAVMVNLRF